LFSSNDEKEDGCASWIAISSNNDSPTTPSDRFKKENGTGDTNSSIYNSVESIRMPPTGRPIDSSRLRGWRFRQTILTRLERLLDADDDDGSNVRIVLNFWRLAIVRSRSRALSVSGIKLE
jgi:hypothetical protein